MMQADTPGAIEHAAAVMLKGGLVAFPTETVYGLGALGLNPLAVAAIFKAKDRPRFDPLILHIAEQAGLERIAVVSDTAWRIAERYWPGPLTIVLPRLPTVPGIITAGLPTVAVRVPAHPVAQALIEAVGEPVAAPSANRFGRLSPTTAAHVQEGLAGYVDVILDGGPTTRGVESTIVAVDGHSSVLLRHGAIPVEDIEETLGVSLVRRQSSSRPTSPGQLDSHYAPHTPVVLADQLADIPPNSGLIVLSRSDRDTGYAVVEELSPTGDLAEAAKNLFAALHRLDKLGLDLIVIRPVPETGVGAAIMDRMRRAAYRPTEPFEHEG